MPCPRSLVARATLGAVAWRRMASPGRGSDGGESLTLTGRVPVEHRFLGLDRRSLLPGLVVIGLFVLWTVVIPALISVISR